MQVSEKSGIRIATFNIRKFSRESVFSTSEKESTKDLETIGKIIRDEKIDILAVQEILHPEALRSLISTIAQSYAHQIPKLPTAEYINPYIAGKTNQSYGYRARNWEGRWAVPNSYYGDLEGYAFIWNTNRISLVETMRNGKKSFFEPRIEEYIGNRSTDNVVRPPFIGRFMPIGGRYEIRLVNTHIAYTIPSQLRNQNSNDEVPTPKEVEYRNQEFTTLISSIYKRFSQEKVDRYTNTTASKSLEAYTFLLGDYNLNLSRYPKLVTGSEPFIVNGNNKYDEMRVITINSELTTLKNRPEDKPENQEKLKMWKENTSDTYHMANNYDHFSFDDKRLESSEKGVGIAMPLSTVVHPFSYYSDQARNSDAEETVYDIYHKRISDHVPVYIDFDVRKKRMKG